MTDNCKKFRQIIGAAPGRKEPREKDDYYATDPKALELLLEKEHFSRHVWECACGEGHLAKVLLSRGYYVKASDLIDRGFGEGGVDFLSEKESWNGDIITNPPFKLVLPFINHALELIPVGNKVAFFLKIQFLEGKERKSFFENTPPARVYVSASRIQCALNGKFDQYHSNTLCYAWFIWEKGYKGETILKWFN